MAKNAIALYLINVVALITIFRPVRSDLKTKRCDTVQKLSESNAHQCGNIGTSLNPGCQFIADPKPSLAKAIT